MYRHERKRFLVDVTCISQSTQTACIKAVNEMMAVELALRMVKHNTLVIVTKEYSGKIRLKRGNDDRSKTLQTRQS